MSRIMKNFHLIAQAQPVKEMRYVTKGKHYKISTTVKETKERLIITRYFHFTNKVIKKVEIFDTNQ